MSDWRRTKVRGWGPDFTEVDAVCHVPDCYWEHTWDNATPLGEIVQEVEAHMRVAHSGGEVVFDHTPAVTRVDES